MLAYYRLIINWTRLFTTISWWYRQPYKVYQLEFDQSSCSRYTEASLSVAYYFLRPHHDINFTGGCVIHWLVLLLLLIPWACPPLACVIYINPQYSYLVLFTVSSSMNLATMRLTCHPHGHSFNMHCITLAPCYQPLMCIFNHHCVLVTIYSIDNQHVSSTMTSPFCLSVTTRQHVMHVFLTVYLCNRPSWSVVQPPTWASGVIDGIVERHRTKKGGLVCTFWYEYEIST